MVLDVRLDGMAQVTAKEAGDPGGAEVAFYGGGANVNACFHIFPFYAGIAQRWHGAQGCRRLALSVKRLAYSGFRAKTPAIEMEGQCDVRIQIKARHKVGAEGCRIQAVGRL